MANKISSATKVVIPCRISFANIFEAKSINGGEAKYSVSCPSVRQGIGRV